MLASGAIIAPGRPLPTAVASYDVTLPTGGAHLAPSLRSHRDNIGQKPEPTYLFFAERNEHKYILSVLKGEKYWAKTKARKPLQSGWKRKMY